MENLEQLFAGMAMNRRASGALATRCLVQSEFLPHVAVGLAHPDPRFAGGCAEVLGRVAEQRPDLVVPIVRPLLALLDHPYGRLRREAARAVAFVAREAPRAIAGQIARLALALQRDRGLPVRDRMLEAVAAYATTGPRAASEALPVLVDAILAPDGARCGWILTTFRQIATVAPHLVSDIRALAGLFVDHPRASIRRRARSLLETLAR